MQNNAFNIENKQQENRYYLFDKAFFSDVSADHFCGDYWQKQDAITGQEKGRGTTWFLRYRNHDLVLRHYLRGGFVSKINKNRYFFRNRESCRSINEFQILNQMVHMGLPVPKPAAAQVIRYGLTYQADLITQRIPGAKDLVQILQSSRNELFYRQLGQTIARFHQHGIYHADLNIQNILQDSDQQFWLIDFDRAKKLKPNKRWQLRNLKRLKRSFEKEKVRHNIQWQSADWDILFQSYLASLQQDTSS